MARPREFDVDEALEAALQAFWTRGYEATSLADLMEATGLQKGSLYKAFGCKHELFARVLEHYFSSTYATMKEALEEPASPKEVIRRGLEMTLSCCNAKGLERGCFAVNSVVEFGPHDAATTKALNAHFARVERLFADTIARGQELGELRDDRSSTELAEVLFMIAKGMLTSSKAGPSKARMKRFADFALESVT